MSKISQRFNYVKLKTLILLLNNKISKSLFLAIHIVSLLYLAIGNISEFNMIINLNNSSLFNRCYCKSLQKYAFNFSKSQRAMS